MENENRSPADLVASLCLDPGFVLVPQDRYEELIRAETERDVLEATLRGDNRYSVDTVMNAILSARSKATVPQKPEPEAGEPDAQ